MLQMKRDGILSDIVNFHEDIPRIAESMAIIARELEAGNYSEAQGAYRNFCMFDIEKHFDIEEQVVFPALQRLELSKKDKEKIADFWMDHRELRMKSSMLAEVVNHVGPDDPHCRSNAQKVKAVLLIFSEFLAAHATREDALYGEIIRSQPGIQLAIGKLYMEYKARARK